ncbi:MAG: hypothetical protein EOO77_34835 [Oxalobacteraceae bacterium]|nr:MAG: hypothetical protein EOO77_34835 [Oxalobacteraceae bacterium]
MPPVKSLPTPASHATVSAKGGGYLRPANPVLATLPTASPTDPEHAYTLSELVDLAHSNNPRTRTAWYEARNAALAAAMVHSSYAPRVVLTGAASGIASRSTLSTLDLRTDGNGDGASGMVALSLEWLLFDFGMRAALVDAARQQSVIANIAFTAEHQLGEIVTENWVDDGISPPSPLGPVPPGCASRPAPLSHRPTGAPERSPAVGRGQPRHGQR